MFKRRYKLVWSKGDGEVYATNLSKFLFEKWPERLNWFARQNGMADEWDFTIYEMTRIY